MHRNTDSTAPAAQSLEVAAEVASAPSGIGWLSAAAVPGGVFALASFIFFFHLGTFGLWEPDEGRYAEIAREMLASRNFIVPHLNYVPYIEKPPLLYWLTTLSMSLFGVNEFAARFFNAAAALAGIAFIFLFTRTVFDPRRAALAATVLATNVLYAVMAQVLTTDMLLTVLVSAAMFTFFMHWREGGGWCWLLYVALGLAVLTKGPVGAAIPTAIGAIFLWRERELRGAIRRFHAVPGLALAGAIAAPWFIAITIREPGFFDFYFIGEHFRRFFQAGYSHNQPIYYFVPIALGGLMPWTLAIPFLRWRGLAANPARRFCLIAVATVFIFFSLASAKLAAYILPAFPPMAILLADGIIGVLEARSASARKVWRSLAPVGPLLALAGFGVLTVGLLANSFNAPYPVMVRPMLYGAAAILMAGGLICFGLFWANMSNPGLIALAATATALLTTVSYGRMAAEPMRSYARLARAIEKREPNAKLVCYPRYVQSLPFYCQRRVILVGARTELAFGADHDPEAASYFFIRRTDLLKLWNTPQPTVFVIDRFALEALRQIFGPWQVIASDAKKVAIMREGSAPAAPMPELKANS